MDQKDNTQSNQCTDDPEKTEPDYDEVIDVNPEGVDFDSIIDRIFEEGD